MRRLIILACALAAWPTVSNIAHGEIDGTDVERLDSVERLASVVRARESELERLETLSLRRLASVDEVESARLAVCVARVHLAIAEDAADTTVDTLGSVVGLLDARTIRLARLAERRLVSGSEVESAQIDLSLARVRLELARAAALQEGRLARLESLRRTGAATQSEVDDAQRSLGASRQLLRQLIEAHLLVGD